MRHVIVPLLLLLLLGGCSGTSFSGDRSVSETDIGGVAEGTLRLDVNPPANDGALLLPQSHIVPPDSYEDLSLELFGTRTVSGVLTAEVTRGWTFGGAPTAPEPLVAGILALADDQRVGAVAQSGEDGAFTLAFPAYPTVTRVAFVPMDATLAPLLVLDAPTFDHASWNQTIEPGIPVYGRLSGIVDGVEQRLADIPLRISRVVAGEVVTSATFTTDASGWYVARVAQLGEYTLEVVGGESNGEGRMSPSLSVPVLVEGLDGVEVSVALGNVDDAAADGRVVDADGNRIADARVRFVSKALESGIGSLEREIDTNSEGRFIIDLLPGVYDVEVVPRFDAEAVDASPALHPNRAVVDGVDLGVLQVGAPARLAGRVLGADEAPAFDVQVVATEVGFGEYVYYGRTDADGTFDFAVTNVPMVVELTPSDSGDGAVTRVEIDDPAAVTSFQLDSGVHVGGLITYEGVVIPYASVKVYDARSDTFLGQAFSNEGGAFSLRVSLPAPIAEADSDTADTEDTADTARDTADDTAADSGADTADTGTDTAR